MIHKNQTLVNKAKPLIEFYFLIAAIEGLVLLIQYFSAYLEETGGQIKHILTTQWVVLICLFVFVIFALLCFFLSTVRTRFQKIKDTIAQKISQKNYLIVQIGLLLFLFSQILFSWLLTRNDFINSEFLLNLLKPLFILFSLVSIQSFLLIAIIARFIGQKDFSNAFFVAFAIILLTWIFVVFTGIGILPDKYYWNVAGVPVLSSQLAVIVSGAFILKISHRFLSPHFKQLNKLPFWVDILLAVIIWGIALQCWQATPFRHSFFFQGPSEPNNDLIPYSDAAYMDLGGQYMLIGEGLQYPLYTEKVLYVFFLGLLHLFAGQSYLATTSLQIAVFALFPVIFYFLGTKFNNRVFGLMLAAFAIIKERNALLSTFKISVSNSRLYMTEFPTALMMLALGLVLFLWLRKPEKKYLGIIAGGILGFSTLIRTNPLVLIPFILVGLILVLRFNWKKWFNASLILLLGFVLAVGPWTVKDQIVYNTNAYFQKIQAVINSRFLHQPLNPNPTGNGFYDYYLLNTKPPSANQQTPQKDPVIETDSKIKVVLGHFLNNEIKTLFTLPFQIYSTSLEATLDQAYWHEPDLWSGELPPETIATFALNLTLISIGVAFAWKKWRFAGLVPLMLNVGYYLSNALGRTSGSRYLLPVDWVTYFYYLAGIYLILTGFKSLKEESAPQNITESAKTNAPGRPASTWISAGVILLLGVSLPVINASFPKLYPSLNEQQLLDKIAITNFSEKTGYSIDEIKDFLSTPDGVLIYGRMLYPRVQEVTSNIQNGFMFTILSPEIHEVYIPQEETFSKSIPAGQDVFVLGCQKDLYTEGFTAYLVNTDQAINNDLMVNGLSCK